MKQILNPYLPLTEYVPDGEPHVFENRLYIYGSHDRANGEKYCEGHYVTWSAPLSDLKSWRFEGEIYRRDQDPSNKDDTLQLWAPDVTKGPDGRYYIYYCLSFYPEIGVAVSDSPAGPFAFYGHVKYPAHLHGGKVLGEHFPFDPAVLTDDDGRAYLYYGFSHKRDMFFMDPEKMKEQGMSEEDLEKFKGLKDFKVSDGGMAVELEPDMLTVKADPHLMVPGRNLTEGTGFEGHGFFEASSMRRVGKKYYFVYSSELSHELCYAVSDKPTEGFRFGGTIVSNGDIGLQGREEPVYTLGNNHGGMVQAGDDWYIFYHRQTNGTEFSRQGCAEKIEIRADGSIPQVEMTSCGLNGGPLHSKGSYPAAIACHLTSPLTMSVINYHDPAMKKQARIVQEEGETPHIADITGDTTVGYKYFDFRDVKGIELSIRGTGGGTVTLSLDSAGTEKIGEAAFTADREWTGLSLPVSPGNGVAPLYFRFTGDMQLAFREFLFT